MKKKSIFKASFEESLNLDDDGFLQYQKRDVFSKLEKSYRKGRPTVGLHIQNIILVLLGPIAINFMILVFSLSLHDSKPKDLTIPVSKYPFLTTEVYLMGLLIWLLLVLIGKFFRRTYILPYRNHFHVITFLVCLSLEFNLLAIDIFFLTLSNIGVITLYVFISLLVYLMMRKEIKYLKKRMYNASSESLLLDRIAKILSTYGTSILGIALLVKIIFGGQLSKISDSMKGVGFLLMWIILNIAVIALIIFMEFPSYLQAYYKWKYPEEYREWEGKSLEEWYGKRYLKKHPELLEKEDYNQTHVHKEDTI